LAWVLRRAGSESSEDAEGDDANKPTRHEAHSFWGMPVPTSVP